MSRILRADSEAEAWRDLRATLFSPPGNATRSAKRRDVYVAALEQAEQLFTAAGSAGAASSPILIFYGLSQAGRALAAAGAMPKGSGWELRSHGLSAPDLGASLTDFPIVQTGRADGSFVALSRLLNSPPLPTSQNNAVSLRDLWETIPEAHDRPLRVSPEVRPPMPLNFQDWEPRHPLASGVLLRIPRWLAESKQRAADFKAFLAAYPNAAGYTFHHRVDDESYPLFNVFDHDVQLPINWYARDDHQPATLQERIAKFDSVATRYQDTWYLIPPVAENTRPLHPLMAWWAVLYALSMLARYQPSAWNQAIGFNTGEHAVAIETLLDEALLAVPRLLHTTLTEVAAQATGP